MSQYAQVVQDDDTDVLMDAATICGKDFCDQCGDCLHCYGEDPCYRYGDEETGHSWVVYANQREQWLAEHPDAKTVP